MIYKLQNVMLVTMAIQLQVAQGVLVTKSRWKQVTHQAVIQSVMQNQWNQMMTTLNVVRQRSCFEPWSPNIVIPCFLLM